ncbi:MAG: GNAT family N-acetyltransferase [Chloroflexi bacterium]|nr:GNAT family N-acetyltransferase [Chloroflexota bacterium]
MIIEQIDGENIFTDLVAEWDDLVCRSMINTPFQHLAYQRGWWEHLHPNEGNLHSIVVRDDEGSLTAVACLYLLEGVLYFNGCVEETDYLDLIVTHDDAQMAWTAVLDCLCSSAFPTWQAMDLCNIPADSPSRQILLSEAEKRGLVFTETIHEVCPIITLTDTFDEYLASINSKQRREIKRKLRRAQGANAQLHIVGPDDDLTQEVEDFLDLLQKSTYEKRDWLNDGRRALFHDTAKSALAAGLLQLMFIEINGRKAAALFNFDYNDRIWVYNSGLDPASFGSLSLGVVLTAKAIEHAIENGRTSFDFLRGNETYKYRFGAVDTNIYKVQLTR